MKKEIFWIRKKSKKEIKKNIIEQEKDFFYNYERNDEIDEINLRGNNKIKNNSKMDIMFTERFYD